MLNNKIFRLSILFIVAAELLSFLGYYIPVFNLVGFFAALIATLVLSLTDIKYGIWIALTELIIGSKGYLFHFDAGDSAVSIRIAVWMTAMSVWFFRIAFNFFKKTGARKKIKELEGLEFFKSAYAPYFIVLFIFILWGLANGLINRNDYGNIFFDFNGWLFFLYVLPVFSAVKSRKDIEELLNVAGAAAIWICVETFILLYAFSHKLFFIDGLYHWIRDTGVGEITQIQGGFSRIFFQSHIYALIGFFAAFVLFTREWNVRRNRKNLLIYFVAMAIFMAANLISLSRSNWIGVAAGIAVFWIFSFFTQEANRKNFLNINAFLILNFIAGIFLIAAIVRFPYPAGSDINTSVLLANRVSQFTEEAGVDSRWALLPELTRSIFAYPVMGKGYGASVTYKSDDPRVLQNNQGGWYTTYAFEWGWLDIWLKLGLFGVLSYLALSLKLIYGNLIKKTCWLNTALAVSLASIAVLSFFSPYMNHPLGIGFLIIFSAISSVESKTSKVE